MTMPLTPCRYRVPILTPRWPNKRLVCRYAHDLSLLRFLITALTCGEIPHAFRFALPRLPARARVRRSENTLESWIRKCGLHLARLRLCPLPLELRSGAQRASP